MTKVFMQEIVCPQQIWRERWIKHAFGKKNTFETSLSKKKPSKYSKSGKFNKFGKFEFKANTLKVYFWDWNTDIEDATDVMPSIDVFLHNIQSTVNFPFVLHGYIKAK